MRKILLLLVAVVCTVSVVSAQKSAQKSFSFDLKSMYRSEVNIGFAATGNQFKSFYTVPGGTDGGGGDTGWGSVIYSTRAKGSYAGDVNTVFSRAFVETIHGLQLNKYLFAGVGVGLQYYCGKLHDFYSYSAMAAEVKGKEKASERWNALAMPLFVAVRGMYPINEDLVPFVNLGIGGTVVFNSAINFKFSEQGSYVKQALRGGFYCDFGGGIRWKRLSGSIGLQHQIVKSVTDSGVTGELASADKVKVNIRTNAFYLKVGWNF